MGFSAQMFGVVIIAITSALLLFWLARVCRRVIEILQYQRFMAELQCERSGGDPPSYAMLFVRHVRRRLDHEADDEVVDRADHA